MDVRRLRSFVAVAEELHFGRAAERLHLSQSALSQQIKALEDGLGVRLFDRDAAGVRLSDGGHVLLPEARAILGRIDATEETMQRWRNGRGGLLRVGVPASLPEGLLARALSTLARAAPDLEVRTSSAASADALRALRDGELHAALVREPPPDGLRAVEVLREPTGAAISTDHPLAAMAAIDPRALVDDDFILLPRRMMPSYYDEVLGALAAAGATPRRIRESPDTETSLDLVGARLGWSLKHQRHVERWGGEARGLTWRPLERVALDTRTWLAWRPDEREQAVGRLRDALTGAAGHAG